MGEVPVGKYLKDVHAKLGCGGSGDVSCASCCRSCVVVLGSREGGVCVARGLGGVKRFGWEIGWE